MLAGHRTWIFEQSPIIISTRTVGGPFEANGAITEDFDLLHADLWLGQDSYEKAHKVLFEEACQKTMEKGGIQKEQVQFIFGGDLINQVTPTSFASKTIGAPYFGLFGACSTSMEGLALGAYIVNTNGAKYILTGASSHNTAVEKQFRYPTEYGGQKPPTAQWTVTGAGAALLSNVGEGTRVTSATIGRNRAWLHTELEKLGVTIENVFLGQVNSYGELTVDLFDDKLQVASPQERPLILATLKKCQADLEKFALGTELKVAKKMYNINSLKLQEAIDKVAPILKK